MFERFTEGAREAVKQAQEAARQMSHAYVGTEHVLLGLLWDAEQLPAQILGSVGVDAEKVRGLIIERVGRGDTSTAAQLPFTPRAKKTLELSLREALTLRHNMIRPGHILLGVLRVEDGMAFQLLTDLKVEPHTVRQQVLEQMGGPDPEGAPQRRTTRMVTPEVRFTVGPDSQLVQLMRAAGSRALREDRDEFGLADLLAVVRENPEARELLDRDGQ